jgi:cell wall-associated NlpC family hydrolase
MWSRNAQRVSETRSCRQRAERCGLVAFFLLAITGCVSTPSGPGGDEGEAAVERNPQASATEFGTSVLSVAERVLGAPYRFGGTTEAGFDCSGLVFFTHRELGITVARTARGQFESSRAVGREQLTAGDLVFFRLNATTVDHVGIYAGASRFIHAPRSGQAVRYDSLDQPYFAERFVGGGRLHP